MRRDRPSTATLAKRTLRALETETAAAALKDLQAIMAQTPEGLARWLAHVGIARVAARGESYGSIDPSLDLEAPPSERMFPLKCKLSSTERNARDDRAFRIGMSAKALSVKVEPGQWIDPCYAEAPRVGTRTVLRTRTVLLPDGQKFRVSGIPETVAVTAADLAAGAVKACDVTWDEGCKPAPYVAPPAPHVAPAAADRSIRRKIHVPKYTAPKPYAAPLSAGTNACPWHRDCACSAPGSVARIDRSAEQIAVDADRAKAGAAMVRAERDALATVDAARAELATPCKHGRRAAFRVSCGCSTSATLKTAGL